VLIIDEDNPDGIDLADKGMGSIQLAILLLRLATLIRKYRGQDLTVLLEEPEQNLHPAIQSMLADLVHDINKNFGVQFIIETHSEYLVRKSQVIVGRKYDSEEKAKENPFRIYYLPQSGLAYSIGYTLNGRLTEKFEPGFFDEAGKSNFYLMRKERGLE
jgi:predicted ATPase